MSGACSTFWRNEKIRGYIILVGKSKRSYCMRDLGVDGLKMLRRMLQKYIMRK
jgi:hypothetical protein